MSEQLCVQWSDFKDNIISSFGILRKENDFTDVTLVSGDGHQIDSHKVVLSSGSPVFKNILKGNKHSHPLIYMRGLKSDDLFAILDFLYSGKANVPEENLESFLAVAEELQVMGLAGDANHKEVEQREEPEIKVPDIAESIIKKKRKASRILLRCQKHQNYHQENLKVQPISQLLLWHYRRTFLAR